eukprot:469721-Pelagomonas_calceolata.AAC.5
MPWRSTCHGGMPAMRGIGCAGPGAQGKSNNITLLGSHGIRTLPLTNGRGETRSTSMASLAIPGQVSWC